MGPGNLSLIRSRRAPAGPAAALAALALLAGAPPAAAQSQEEGAQPAAPGAGAPRVVISGRDLRMNLTGVIPLRIGCFGSGGFCGGRLEARLAEPLIAPARRGRTAPKRTYQPFGLGRGGFGVGASRSQVVRLRFFPRAAYLVRLAGAIPVVISARPTSGARPADQVIAVYVSPLQRFR